MLIPEGTYTIGNVEFSNFTSLSDGNKGPVLASNDDRFSGSKWNIIPLSGNRYHIRNYQYPSLYAWFKPRSEQGEHVIGNYLKAEWIIRETLKKGVYTISPADKEDLFWGLENHQANSPIELKKGQNAKYNHWAFHSGPQIVETIIDDLELSLEWMDTTNKLREPIHARLSGLLHGLDLPRDASISFPKPLDVIWNKRLVGSAVLHSTYGPTQADFNAVNMDITPTQNHTTVSDFVRTLLKQKSTSVELSVNEITVTAGGKKYSNVAASFRKTVFVRGFNSFENMVHVHSIRITGSDRQGMALAGTCRIEIRNPTQVSVLMEDFPVEVYYEGAKIANFVVPAFRLQYGSTGTVSQDDIPIQLKPDDPRMTQYTRFISKYLSTKHILPVSLYVSKAMIRLPLSTVSIPSFSVDSTIQGINNQLVKCCIGYISFLRVPVANTFDFAFEFVNPIDAPLTIKFLQGRVKRHGQLIGQFAGNVRMDILARQNLLSPKIQGATLDLSPSEKLNFIGMTNLVVDVDVERATVRYDGLSSFPEGVDAKLAWSFGF